MTKQGEIRMNLYILTLDYFKKFHKALYEKGEECPTQPMCDKILSYLYSQGVVIRGECLGISHPHLANYFTVESLIEE